MDVRLTGAWTDATGVRHLAGEVIEVDPVTLAELEERQVVDAEDVGAEESEEKPVYVGPGSEKKYVGPGSEKDYVGPGSEPADQQKTDSGQ